VRLTDEATVGEQVLFYRRRKGITQEVLAGLLGRSVEWLAQFERGAKELDRLSTIVAIADALGSSRSSCSLPRSPPGAGSCVMR
jgi:transcriptional regulator with XRE-family HTH domain